MIRIYYANIYAPFAGSCGSVYETRELADQMAARGRLACIPFALETIEVTELGAAALANEEPAKEPHRSV